MKWKHAYILGLVILLLVTTAHAAEMCEDKLTPGKECTMLTPSLLCSNYVYQIMNTTHTVTSGTLTPINSTVYSFTFNLTKGNYIVQLCDNSTREIIVEGGDEMGSLTIGLFFLVCSVGVGVLPFVVKRFHEHPIADMVIRRSCYVIGLFMMLMVTVVMKTIASDAGLSVQGELNFFLWFFGMAGAVGGFIIVLSTLIDTLRMWRQISENKSFGDDYE